MDYFKEAETVLFSRKKLDIALYDLRAKLEFVLESDKPKEPSAIDYKRGFSDRAYVNSTLEDLLKVSELSRRVKRTERKIADIDRALSRIENKQHRDILKFWYIEGLKMDDVAGELGYSPFSKQSLYNLRNEAVFEFALYYFGAEAM